MTFPPRKKKRYIEKMPGGEVHEVLPSLEDHKSYYGEEREQQFRMKGVD